MTKQPEQNGAPGQKGDVVSFTTLDSPIKSGEQGSTWLARATTDVNLSFVVKLCKTSSGPQGSKAVEHFKRECQVLAALGHANIVHIFNYGDEITRGTKILRYPFYIMENLGNTAKSLTDILKLLKSEGITRSHVLLVCLCTLRDAASALAQVHAKGYRHGDIKESNILIRDPQAEKPDIRLIDFGFADLAGIRTADNSDDPVPGQRSSIIRHRKCPSDYNADIFQLCYMAHRVMNEIGLKPKDVSDAEKSKWPIDPASWDHLTKLIDEWASEEPNSKPETADYNEFYEELAALTRSYDLPPEVRGAVRYLSIQEIATAAEIRQAFEAVRIPPRQLVLYTERISKLITSPEFGALRYKRQLGFTHLVYPGAQGTRFEHSLGMFNLACHFVIRMSGHDAFRTWCENEHNVLKFIIAALLHDVGHFSYAHQLEEFTLNDFEISDRQQIKNLISGHETRGEEIITSDCELSRILRESFSFTTEDIEDVCWMAFPKGKQRTKLPDGRPSKGKNDAVALRFLSELLHGPIDLDKLDYVERDAHHCGVPYGNYLDLPRIIETMRVIDGGGGFPVLAFDARIIGSLEQFATARHELYANVYWHRAVRSATVMFKHVFFLLQGLIADEKKLRELFHYSFTDDLLLARIRELAQRLEAAACLGAAGKEQQDSLQKTRAILMLLQAVSGEKRVLYKSVLERDQEMRKEFGGDSYTNQRQKANGLFEDLKNDGFFGPEADQLGEHNLLIDCHFHQFPKFNEVKIVQGPSETTASLDRLAPSLRGLPESFSKQACKIRIFVNPDALKLEYRSKGGRAKVREYLEGKFPKAE